MWTYKVLELKKCTRTNHIEQRQEKCRQLWIPKNCSLLFGSEKTMPFCKEGQVESRNERKNEVISKESG